MIELKGTHGTCASFAEVITRDGFNIAAGRRGKGAYFWGYTSTLKDYATILAKAWWVQAKSMRRYDSATDQACVVLYATIQTEGAFFLDLEEHQMKQKLSRFLNDCFKRKVPLDRSDMITRSYDLFVEMIEREIRVKFNVIHVTVNPPQKEYFENVDRVPPFDLMGMPACYVVKSNKCISLER